MFIKESGLIKYKYAINSFLFRVATAKCRKNSVSSFSAHNYHEHNVGKYKSCEDLNSQFSPTGRANKRTAAPSERQKKSEAN